LIGPEQSNGKWYNIIKRTGEELAFYDRQGIVPSLRKMYYRLIELGVLTKTDSNYKHFAEKTAEARRGVKSDYITPTDLPKLPIDCFRDDTRDTIGRWDMSPPSDPTPNLPPDDPIRVANMSIWNCKDAILNYDGSCYQGERGVMPGRWYKQPIYCVVLCESDTIKPDLERFQRDRGVRVGAVRGWTSTGYIHDFCKELYEIATKHGWIEKIVVLYFGDYDKTGHKIRRNIEAALEWYQCGSDEFTIPVEVELRLVAVTPEQVKKYNLTGSQIEAFMTTEKRLRDFKKILLDAIDDCWDENIYDKNCPPEEYDYESHGEKEPEDSNPDNEFYGDTGITIREKMIRTATEAFKEGWEEEEEEE
jgi:hypothetical protein